MDASLTVQIYSFGYQRSGIPTDATGNGGGFVFDCRHLPNPGTEVRYKLLTGRDAAVIAYFQQYPIVEAYLQDVFRMVDRAISVYRERQFTDLMVVFGCTGGQHRSIYCAEQLNRHLQSQGVNTIVRHTELPLIQLKQKLAGEATAAVPPNAGVTSAKIIFCDPTCPDAAFPTTDAVDGARSCRTFSALWCRQLNALVSKNAPCTWRYGKRRPKAGW
ncbi:hypothetical protein L0128_15820 [candidate division KSB1 bacterium]|nr:hypothetical protein [candidate division KSB1 bacterium]